jgi:hypothetical protein
MMRGGTEQTLRTLRISQRTGEIAVAEDQKKSLHMSTRLTRSLKKRGKMEVGCRVPRIAIEDVKDAEKEQAASSYQKVFLARSLLPQRHGDYHMMLR